MAVEVREFKGSYGVFVDGDLRTRTPSMEVAADYASTLDGSGKPRKILVVEKSAEETFAENAAATAGPKEAPSEASTSKQTASVRKPANRKRGATRKKTAGF